MAEFTVTASELLNKAAELERLNNSLKQKIETLNTEETTLSTMWEGPSHDAFHSRYAAEKGKMMLFHSTMEKYVTALRAIAAAYNSGEAKNVTTAGSR